MSRRLDEIDRRIIYSLQEGARNTTAPRVAEGMDVSPETIRYRINQLEDTDIISGYHADIDYRRCESRLTNLFVCTIPASEHKNLVKQAVTVPGVVNVRKLRTGRENLQITAVGEDLSDFSEIAQQLSKLGIELEGEELIQEEYFTPYEPFGPGSTRKQGKVTDMFTLPDEAEIIDITVGTDAPIAERTLHEAKDQSVLSDDILVIAIEGQDEILTPNGDTLIRAGDCLSVFGKNGVPEKALEAFGVSVGTEQPPSE